MMNLIDEIEAIVGSGTKLNIDYYLNEIMDDDKLDEIYEYFREAENESIDKALAELGEEYFSEEEIRLVRIKFFSDLAN
jgi:ATP-dependent DNA helicase RecQ